MYQYHARNMKDVIRYNKSIGHYFFDKGTMNFFGSKIESELYENNTFITSEDNYNRTERLYSVRHYNPENAHIKTVGVFQQFKTKEDAERFALAYKEE